MNTERKSGLKWCPFDYHGKGLWDIEVSYNPLNSLEVCNIHSVGPTVKWHCYNGKYLPFVSVRDMASAWIFFGLSLTYVTLVALGKWANRFISQGALAFGRTTT